MLRSLRLLDFKSFADQTVRFAPLTLLVGANASGKSNVFDALHFLAGVGQGLPIGDVLRGRLEGGRATWPGLRGGQSEVARHGAASFRLESTWELPGHPALTHSLHCGLNPTPSVLAEKLRAEGMGDYLFDTHAPTLGGKAGLGPGGALSVALERTGKGNSISVQSPSAASLLHLDSAHPELHPQVPKLSRALAEAMRRPLFLDISPRLMRDYVPKAAVQLGAQGENVSAVVADLCRDEGRRRELVDWLSELCAPDVVELAFVETTLGDVLLQLVEGDGAAISARALSDGTLRFLGILAALLTAAPSSVVLIEELENGLHPSRLDLLIQLLLVVTRERGVQVLATTHSPRVLEALALADRQALEQAIVCGRVPGEPGTLARRLGDLPGFGALLERRGMEHAFTTRWLERAL